MKSTNTNGPHYGIRCTSVTYSMKPSLYEIHKTHDAGTPLLHLLPFFNHTRTISIGSAVYSSPHGRVNRIINMIDDRMIDNLLISFRLFQYRTSMVAGDRDWLADSASLTVTR